MNVEEVYNELNNLSDDFLGRSGISELEIEKFSLMLKENEKFEKHEEKRQKLNFERMLKNNKRRR